MPEFVARRSLRDSTTATEQFLERHVVFASDLLRKLEQVPRLEVLNDVANASHRGASVLDGSRPSPCASRKRATRSLTSRSSSILSRLPRSSMPSAMVSRPFDL